LTDPATDPTTEAPADLAIDDELLSEAGESEAAPR
jgi:hypothetical protein